MKIEYRHFRICKSQEMSFNTQRRVCSIKKESKPRKREIRALENKDSNVRGRKSNTQSTEGKSQGKNHMQI